MDSGNAVGACSEIRQLSWFLQPSSLKQRVEQLLPAAIYSSRTDDKYLHIFFLNCQHFVLDIFDIAVSSKRHPVHVVIVLPECILNRFLFDKVF